MAFIMDIVTVKVPDAGSAEDAANLLTGLLHGSDWNVFSDAAYVAGEEDETPRVHVTFAQDQPPFEPSQAAGPGDMGPYVFNAKRALREDPGLQLTAMIEGTLDGGRCAWLSIDIERVEVADDESESSPQRHDKLLADLNYRANLNPSRIP